MEKNSYIEPVYLISVVADILGVHPQTLRQYEREGLIKPSRTNGKIRLYSQKDIHHIKYVLTNYPQEEAVARNVQQPPLVNSSKI